MAAPHTNTSTAPASEESSSHFIRDIVENDLREGIHETVVTRFPPEPNGYLHIGHAKAIVLDFGLADEFGGATFLRMDDTNPTTEDMEYVEAIQGDVRWLGYDWKELRYASDYFEPLYAYAVKLIEKGLAYVDSQSEEEIRETRGTVTEAGTPSPYRDRSVEENLRLFEQMRDGAFPDGAHVLRAKIDMSSTNMKMRDPLLYRIKRGAHHYRTGEAWDIYPMYDFAHPLSDALEGITHSLCTLEFDNNRELYDWVLEHCLDEEQLPSRPHQYEFSRLNLDYTIMSKRKLLVLVRDGHVDGWDDPRMPTISGMRRRGVTPSALRTFCEKVGITKTEGRVDIGLLEHVLRDDLNFEAPRVLCVLKPLKVTLTNVPEDETEWLDASYWPHDVPKEGSRKVPFSRTLYIERDDFMEDPPKKFYRLSPGAEVRLRHGYIIRCDEVVKDDDGEVVELKCTVDPDSRSGSGSRRVKGTIHWVSAPHAKRCTVRLYDRLFKVAHPDGGEEPFTEHLNPDSAVMLTDAMIEPSVLDDEAGTRYQFERHGYFWQDPQDSSPDALVFNRIVSLRDSWSKMAKAQQQAPAKKPKPQKAPQQPVEKRDPVEDFDADQMARFERLHGDAGLDRSDAAILAAEAPLTAYFDEAVAAHDDPQGIANWIVNDLQHVRKDTPLDELRVRPAQLARLVALQDDGTVSSRIARDVFEVMVETGQDPDAIVEERGLKQVSDADTLVPIIDEAMSNHPDKVEAYRGGKTGLMGFFMGQVMRRTQGKADPELAKSLLEERLN